MEIAYSDPGAFGFALRHEFALLVAPSQTCARRLSAELEFECIASWKDGSDKYIYGSFRGAGLATRDAYRCFVSQPVNQSINQLISQWERSIYAYGWPPAK